MDAVTIVFDLDGTLVDTAPDLINATNHVMSLIGEPNVDTTTARSWISHGARHMITQALSHTNNKKDDTDIDNLLERFLEHYANNIARESKPFPDVEVILERFRCKGYKLAICTNKRKALAELLLDELKMTNSFDAIAGRDTFAFCKPDARHILETVKMAGGNQTRSIMVGDSANDIDAAQNANIPSIAVSFGYSKTPPHNLGADAVIDHMNELERVIDSLLRRHLI